MLCRCVSGAMCMCSFGTAPSVLNILPTNRGMGCSCPMGTITDFIPIVNIAPFGQCTSLSNPTTAAATAAALGVLTPMPCIPVTQSPWIPTTPSIPVGSSVILNMGDKTTCMLGGLITITSPGQFIIT